MSFLKHMSNGEEKCSESSESMERAELIGDYSSIEEIRNVIENYKEMISEKVTRIATRMKTNSLEVDDFKMLNCMGRIKPVYDDNFVPEVIYWIKTSSKVDVMGTTLYMLPVRFDLTDKTPRQNNRNYVNIDESLTLFRTTLILEKDQYVRIKIKSNEDDATVVAANSF